MLMFLKILICYINIFLYVISYTKCETKNYCAPKFCNNTKKHIMCKFQSPGPAIDCMHYENLLKTEKEKLDVLDRINGRRNKVSGGEIRSLPSAENMLKLEWSEDLEIFAQRWADQCAKNKVVEFCQDLENSSVGQNIGTIYGDAPGLSAPTLVDLWYMELLNANLSSLLRYKSSSSTNLQHYDYFTQLIWAETSHVGCAAVKYKETNNRFNRTVHRLVCNFAPSGNIIGEDIYSDGLPCSRCPQNGHCDSEYPYLCSSISQGALSEINIRTKDHSHKFYFDRKNLSNNSVHDGIIYKLTTHTELHTLKSEITADFSNDDDTNFDILSHLFDLSSTTSASLMKTSATCKDLLPVDQFIELLKNKLSDDQSLKDLLISSNKTTTFDPSFTDRTIAAMINQLYSKKETTTVNKPTQEELINSTLLANLVEAVIFRHSDRFCTTEDMSLHTTIIPNVSPVKIQAELGEVVSNVEFTGHYFFPEEDEQKEQETTEFYDVENLPFSEISVEIDDLKRSRETKDFLEDILESDFITESITSNQPILKKNNVTFLTRFKKALPNIRHHYKSIKRFKRRPSNYFPKADGIFIKYMDLLNKLAIDLRNLRLNEKFHCGSSVTESRGNLYRYKCNVVLVITYLLFKIM